MIEARVVDGRRATVSYLTADFEPAARDACELIKIAFEGGDTRFAVPGRVAAADWNPDQPREPAGTPEGGQWTSGAGGGAPETMGAPSEEDEEDVGKGMEIAPRGWAHGDPDEVAGGPSAAVIRSRMLPAIKMVERRRGFKVGQVLVGQRGEWHGDIRARAGIEGKSTEGARRQHAGGPEEEYDQEQVYERGYVDPETKTYYMAGGTGVDASELRPRGARVEHARPGVGARVWHVTLTKNVAAIRKQGLRRFQTSNWLKAGDRSRYGAGEVYAFADRLDAERWAARMDWELHQRTGSGKVSIVEVDAAGAEWQVDRNDPLSQAGGRGAWLKSQAAVRPEHVVGAEKFDAAAARTLAERLRKAEIEHQIGETAAPAGAPGGGDAAVTATLTQAGFKRLRVADLPPRIVESNHFSEPAALGPDHEAEARGVALGADAARGTMLEAAAGALGKTGVAFADYDPRDASMSTISGLTPDGRGVYAVLTVNTAFAHDPDPSIPPLAYSGAKGREELERTGDRARWIEAETKVSTLHELAHVTDRLLDGALTKDFVAALKEEAGPDEGKMMGFLAKNISRYCLHSAREAMAEAAAKFVTEGDLPGELGRWGRQVTEALRRGPRKKRRGAADAAPPEAARHEIHNFYPNRLPPPRPGPWETR